MERFDSVESLELALSEPSEDLVSRFKRLDGDILFLGVGGKMGPTMARMAKRASDLAGGECRVIGVSRFSDQAARDRLEQWGVETIACDLLCEDELAKLPDSANVVYMSGFKFGASANPPRTWAMNCYAPALACQRFQASRMTAFSSGNIYGLTTPESGGSCVGDQPQPNGEYAWTALGRERMFQFFSRERSLPLTLLRLNYATELRYGVLVDLALAVRDEVEIDVTMSHVNVLWLGDANEMTLRALTLTHSDELVINLAGRDILNVATVCRQFGELLGKQPKFVGEEMDRALLNNGTAGYESLGSPRADAEQMIEWTADWVLNRRELHGKPTHFAVSDGKF